MNLSAGTSRHETPGIMAVLRVTVDTGRCGSRWWIREVVEQLFCEITVLTIQFRS